MDKKKVKVALVVGHRKYKPGAYGSCGVSEFDYNSKLAQDIADLALYPERLQESYRKEWEAYVLKALAFEIRQHDNLSPAEFIELMMSKVEAIQQNNDTYHNLLRQVHHAKSILQSENTVIFPTPLRQQLTAFLLPITTITPPKK